MRRILLGLVLASMLPVAAEDEVGPQPLEQLPPIPAPVAIDPKWSGSERQGDEPSAVREVDRSGLQADLQALLRIRERVMRRLKAGEIQGEDPEKVMTELARQQLSDPADDGARTPSGPPIVSNHLDIQVQAFVGNTPGGRAYAEVDATVRDEPVEVVYRELVALRGYSLDDQQVSSGRRRVALNVRALPWTEALTRVLGQVGLGWRFGVDGTKVYVFEVSREARPDQELVRLAEEAFIAAGSDPEDPYSAEARYLRARQIHRGGDPVVALAAYEEVYQALDRNHPDFALARPWVRRAVRGTGDALMELEQYRDARSVYLNYISTAEEEDPTLPMVYFQAAEAARAIGIGIDGSAQDPAALDQAEDLLERLIQRFDGDQYQGMLAKARLTLGRLLYDQDKYAAAKVYLGAHAQAVGEAGGDQLQYLLAECDYHLAAAARHDYRFNTADELLTDARKRYEGLFDKRNRDKSDPLVSDEALYRDAAYKIGLCWQDQTRPDYVRALLAFLRARNEFHDSPMDGDLLVRITRCYSELQRRERSIEALSDLLRQMNDGTAPEAQIEQLMADILVNAKSYDGTTKAKVHFYIAQSHYQVAQRDPRQRADRLERAMYSYQRVLDARYRDGERVDLDLILAARLGMGRAALEAGDEDRGVQFLKEVLRSDKARPRDRAFAAQLLGDHFRGQGRFEEALKHYQAYRIEGAE
ncbi:MAG: hypothetical protein PF961_19250 [Planctomycetota bacterium]|jgi:hypothetical protein|nr:hypothetical protein [Planctomycetota bacterium]